jgi:hypothetical protein
MHAYLPCCSLCFAPLALIVLREQGEFCLAFWHLTPGMFAPPNFPPVPDCHLPLARRPSSSFLSLFRRSCLPLGHSYLTPCPLLRLPYLNPCPLAPCFFSVARVKYK